MMSLPRRYFDEIKRAWSPYQGGNYRIIPFCTPVPIAPEAIVIGTNHSDFVIGGGALADQIASDFEHALPQVNTYLAHNNKFSTGLNEVCVRAGIKITENWLGTNRCALQTGSKGIGTVGNEPKFIRCQITMDQILRSLITELEPKNIILVGRYATGLYYPSSLTFEMLRPMTISFLGKELNIIPLQHPSRATYWDKAAERLKYNFQV